MAATHLVHLPHLSLFGTSFLHAYASLLAFVFVYRLLISPQPVRRTYQEQKRIFLIGPKYMWGESESFIVISHMILKNVCKTLGL